MNLSEKAGLAGAGGCGAAFLAWAVRGRTSSVFGPSVYRGPRNRKAIALTFDDGPSESTPALLELLAEYNIKATFFMCGANVRRLNAIAREVAAAGHEIGNHSDSHAPMYFKSPEFIFREVALAQETIVRVTRVTPRFFRAPYGVRWPGLRRAQSRLNLYGMMWTAIARDWKWPPRRISRLLLSRASNGAILCLHDGRELQRAPDIRATLDAVEFALPLLIKQGFSFETVSQITSSRAIPR
jgi:peptidoglycan/xylan/chitin deacetylase (PgdA/CDA1 family)